MTAAEIASLRALMAKATPEPWEPDRNGTYGKYIRTVPDAKGRYHIVGRFDYADRAPHDHDFILAAVNALPALMAAAEDAAKLRAALGRLADLIDSAGIRNLATGVQLGPVSWTVKMDDAMEQARAAYMRDAL